MTRDGTTTKHNTTSIVFETPGILLTSASVSPYLARTLYSCPRRTRQTLGAHLTPDQSLHFFRKDLLQGSRNLVLTFLFIHSWFVSSFHSHKVLLPCRFTYRVNVSFGPLILPTPVSHFPFPGLRNRLTRQLQEYLTFLKPVLSSPLVPSQIFRSPCASPNTKLVRDDRRLSPLLHLVTPLGTLTSHYYTYSPHHYFYLPFPTLIVFSSPSFPTSLYRPVTTFRVDFSN